MYGEIMVLEIMDRAGRLRAWHERQQRDAEWAALKQWWRAEERVHAATNEHELKAAIAVRSHTAQLYGAELQRAWPKWATVRKDRAARRSAQNRERATAVKWSAGLRKTASIID